MLAFLSVTHNKTAIVKPQISLFERMGIPGLEVRQALVERARELGLLVLLDAKRGDIGEPASGYSEQQGVAKLVHLLRVCLPENKDLKAAL